MLSCNPLQRFETIYFVLYREITFLGKSTKKSKFYQNGRLETNFKYVAIIETLRAIMHA